MTTTLARRVFDHIVSEAPFGWCTGPQHIANRHYAHRVCCWPRNHLRCASKRRTLEHKCAIISHYNGFILLPNVFYLTSLVWAGKAPIIRKWVMPCAYMISSEFSQVRVVLRIFPHRQSLKSLSFVVIIVRSHLLFLLASIFIQLSIRGVMVILCCVFPAEWYKHGEVIGLNRAVTLAPQ